MADIKRNGGNGRRSLATAYDGLVYTSGITSVLLEEDARAQTQDVFRQLDALLAHYDTDKTRVLQATVTLADIADYGEFNAAWDEWVLDAYEPARSVTEGALAIKGYRVKISLIAAK